MSSWFLLPPEALEGKKKVILQKEHLSHLKALRLAGGDPIVLADGRGRAYKARLEYIGSQNAEASLLYELAQKVEPPLEVTLFLGVSKREKIDLVIRHSVELGVRKIIPVLTERTVVKITAEKGKEKAMRWRKIAASAVEQCRRSFIPEVLPPLPFTEALALMREHSSEENPVIVPWEEETRLGIGELAEKIKNPSSVSLFTGPEGGFSLQEMEKLRKITGVYPVTLGPRILRAETAPLAVLSIVMYLWGDLSRGG